MKNCLSKIFNREKLLFSIWKDLGHNNFGLFKGDLLKMFIKDPSEIELIVRKNQIKPKE